jgi:isoleucyl-tRNA synthetase
MAFAMELADAANSLRAENKIKLRWPVAEFAVSGGLSAQGAVSELSELLKSATNSLKVAYCLVPKEGWPSKGFGKGMTLYLNPQRDGELLRMAALREVTRAVQAARKASGLVVSDRISLWLGCSDSTLEKYLLANEKALLAEVGAKDVEFSAPKPARSELDLSELGMGKVAICIGKD